mmetsp:Transcript_17496/g.25935  ORF Transcript_17496/g.25935 Transcript_17496/m.25935 type:complete len:259 (-) Transcript_17496:523-1299(-)
MSPRLSMQQKPSELLLNNFSLWHNIRWQNKVKRVDFSLKIVLSVRTSDHQITPLHPPQNSDVILGLLSDRTRTVVLENLTRLKDWLLPHNSRPRHFLDLCFIGIGVDGPNLPLSANELDSERRIVGNGHAIEENVSVLCRVTLFPEILADNFNIDTVGAGHAFGTINDLLAIFTYKSSGILNFCLIGGFRRFFGHQSRSHGLFDRFTTVNISCLVLHPIQKFLWHPNFIHLKLVFCCAREIAFFQSHFHFFMEGKVRL